MRSILLVDCDNTLHSNDQRMHEQAQAVQTWFSRSTKEILERYFAAHDRIHADFPERHDDQAFHFELMAEALDLTLPERGGEQAAKAWQAAYDAYQLRPFVFPDVRPTLESLQKAGITLILVSGSTNEERRAFLKCMGLESYFANIFGANSVGYQKKDPRFYQTVFQTLNINGEEASIVGDSVHDDISAKKFGVFTYWLNRDQKPWSLTDYTPDRIVTSLTEVAEDILNSSSL